MDNYYNKSHDKTDSASIYSNKTLRNENKPSLWQELIWAVEGRGTVLEEPIAKVGNFEHGLVTGDFTPGNQPNKGGFPNPFSEAKSTINIIEIVAVGVGLLLALGIASSLSKSSVSDVGEGVSKVVKSIK